MDDYPQSSMVAIEPADQLLVFSEEEHPAPGTTGLAATITIHNKHTDRSLLFRVQTTSPLSYRVRPSHGRLDPTSSSSVNIVLAVDSKKGDKFLVKYVLVAPTADGDFNDLFQMSGKAEEYRLRCVLPEGFQAKPQEHVISATSSAMSSTGNLPDPSPAASPQPTASPQPPTKEDLEKPTEPPVVPVIISAPAPPIVEEKIVNKTDDEVIMLRAKLKEAMASNEQLKQKIATLQDSSISQRSVVSQATTTAEDGDALLNRALVHANQNNLPPVLVALIALFAFLLGLLF